MYTIYTWPWDTPMAISSHAHRLLHDVIVTPFDNSQEAKAFWHDTKCCLHIQLSDYPTVLTDAQTRCLLEPDFVEHHDGCSLYCQITGNAGGGVFLLILHAEEV
jgi:hypothetical protein